MLLNHSSLIGNRLYLHQCVKWPVDPSVKRLHRYVQTSFNCFCEHCKIEYVIVWHCTFLNMWVVEFKLCHITQVQLKLRFTAIERFTELLFFIYKCAGIFTTLSISYPVGVSHTHFNWHAILWLSWILLEPLAYILHVAVLWVVFDIPFLSEFDSKSGG